MKSDAVLFYTISKKFKLTLATLSSIFVFLFLIFFQPFGINNYRSDEKISLILLVSIFGFALIIFIIILICEFLIRPKVLKSISAVKYFVWLIVEIITICTATFFVYNALGEFHDFHLLSYLKHILELGTVLSFPYAATLFYFKHSAILKEYHDVLSWSKQTDVLQEIVLLSGDYKNDQIALSLNTIVYLESEDNYVRLNYLEDTELKKYLIRSTLSSLEQKLTSEFFLRCNRSVIVNMAHIESYKYNQKKLVLKLKLVSSPITISKSQQNKALSFLGN